jgi:hypothetical protein
MEKKSNSYKKKYNAAVHNYVHDIKDSLLPIGICKCGKTIFMYLKSSEENIPKYYCEDKNCEIGDIRNPKDGDNFFFPLKEIAKVLIDNYGNKIKSIFEEIKDD